MAVLYRMNALSRVYEQAFLEGGIPYRVVRGTAFYERKEIKDVLAFLRLAVNPWDRLSLFRVGNMPPRGLGKKRLESLAEVLGKTGEGDGVSLWKRLEETGLGLRGKADEGVRALARHMRNLGERKNAVDEAIRYVMDDLEYAAFLRETEPENWEEREENVFELLSVIPSEGTLEEFLGEVALFTDLDRREDGSEDAVNLLTLHAAKGLEFPVVLLADTAKRFNLTDTKRPLLMHAALGVGMKRTDFDRRAAYTTLPRMAVARKLSGETAAEELRVLYVAMTRARERLIVVATFRDARRELYEGQTRAAESWLRQQSSHNYSGSAFEALVRNFRTKQIQSIQDYLNETKQSILEG
jgi:superfamily I DNA/RNA helicase